MQEKFKISKFFRSHKSGTPELLMHQRIAVAVRVATASATAFAPGFNFREEQVSNLPISQTSFLYLANHVTFYLKRSEGRTKISLRNTQWCYTSNAKTGAPTMWLCCGREPIAGLLTCLNYKDDRQGRAAKRTSLRLCCCKLYTFTGRAYAIRPSSREG